MPAQHGAPRLFLINDRGILFRGFHLVESSNPLPGPGKKKKKKRNRRLKMVGIQFQFQEPRKALILSGKDGGQPGFFLVFSFSGEERTFILSIVDVYDILVVSPLPLVPIESAWCGCFLAFM